MNLREVSKHDGINTQNKGLRCYALVQGITNNQQIFIRWDLNGFAGKYNDDFSLWFTRGILMLF